MSEAIIEHDVLALLDYLKKSRGFDFTGYKRASLLRRFDKRIQTLGMTTYAEYTDYLEVHPEEFSQLFNTILINVTRFFRDPAAWDYLAAEIVPQIVERKEPGESLRIWSAGCASGEEPYTLAMVLAESLGVQQLSERVKIYATDVDEDALNRARQGTYSAAEIEDVPKALRDKYLDRAAKQYVLHKNLRGSVIFGRHDLVQDAPISHLDLLVCRNTLIYFNAETQSRILSRFRFSINQSGFLFLGKSETLLARTDVFTAVAPKQRVFTSVAKVRRRHPDLPTIQPSAEEPIVPLAAELAAEVVRDAAFETAHVGQLVVDLEGFLVAANHEVRALFGLSPEDLGRTLQDLDLDYYKPLRELRSQIERAYAGRSPSASTEIEWPTAAGEARFIDVQVMPVMAESGDPLGVSLTFADVTRYHGVQAELERSKGELETAYEELQSSNEELETTNEEMLSSNEELETTNEELQSSNEELETINEELQSTNEELHTINAQFHQRERELIAATAFSEAILANIPAGVIVVDKDLKVEMWSSRAQDLWGARADEVEGRNLLTLDIGLPVELLRECIGACLAGQSAFGELALDAVNRRGKAILCKISCTPLEGPPGDIRGVILFMEAEGDVGSSRARGPSAMEEDLAPKSRQSSER
ncbi:MAG TPA: CheR family methyltransferase [Gaiellaceae bacterium]|nr:CheR family methyltransferase [Gaiellaceae bacterium]